MKADKAQFQDRSLSPWRKVLLLLAGYAFATVFLLSVTLVYVAYRESQKLDKAHLEHAVRLNPLEAEYRAKLGQWSLFAENNAGEAARSFETATRLNPYEARYWLALATARLQLADTTGEFEAVRNAAAAAPTTPEIAWEAGIHLMVGGHEREALHTFRTLLGSAPGECDRVVALCWRALHDRQRILNEVLPREQSAYLTFLRLLANTGAYDDADEVWKATVDLGQPIPKQSALMYIDDLLRREKVQSAASAWRSLLSLDPVLRRYRQDENLVMNSRFEEPLLDDGFDWRFPAPGGAVEFSLDSNEARAGSASLLLTFRGDVVGDTGLYQAIVVQPETEYSFRATVKSSELVSATPLRFEFRDAYSGELAATTGEFVGTTGDWITVTGRFRTAPKSRLLKLGVGHAAASHVAGKMWIDSVELKPLDANAAGR